MLTSDYDSLHHLLQDSMKEMLSMRDRQKVVMDNILSVANLLEEMERKESK